MCVTRSALRASMAAAEDVDVSPPRGGMVARWSLSLGSGLSGLS